MSYNSEVIRLVISNHPVTPELFSTFRNSLKCVRVFQIELEFGRFFLRRGENRSTRKKTSWSKGENQQQTQATYGVNARIRTQATLVGSECSDHCTTIVPPYNLYMTNLQLLVQQIISGLYEGSK